MLARKSALARLAASASRVRTSSSAVRCATRCSSSALRVRTLVSAALRSAISCSSVCSMPLKESASCPTSSFVVLGARSPKSRLCMTCWATTPMASIGRVMRRCSRDETSRPNTRLAASTRPKMKR